MSIDEARSKEGLPPVAGGDSVFLQRQMTSIDLLAQLQQSELDAKKEPAPAPPPVEPADEANPEVAKALVVSMFDYKRKQV